MKNSHSLIGNILNQQAHAIEEGDCFLFSGNRQENVPRGLLLDCRLTPLERNAWQVIRMMLDNTTILTTYELLRPYLTSMPGAEKASLETINRTLTILRLTRWLSLARRRRCKKTGRVQANLYVLHDAPLTPYEAIQLDQGYLMLINRSISHNSKAIQITGVQALNEVLKDPSLTNSVLPTRLQILAQQLELSTVPDSEVSKNRLLRNQDKPNSESETSVKPCKTGSFRNPKPAIVCSSKKNIHTIRSANHDLVLPERFYFLSSEQQKATLSALQHIDKELQQKIVNEWDTRCKQEKIRKPAAYLFGILQKAQKGEFNAWTEDTDQPIVPSKSPPPSAKLSPKQSEPIDRELALKNIAIIKSLIKIRK